MRYLPMSFDTRDKTALIIGGDFTALDRIKRLLESEFKIYVIAKDFIEEIINISTENSDRVFLKQGKLDENFVFFGYDYLIIATHDFELNDALEERAKRSNILYERCDFISSSDLLMNKVISKEGLTVGITTNGVNPTVTDIVYEDIAELLKKYNEEKILILNKIRRELVKRNALNVDEKIRELYDKEKITLDTYLNRLEHDEVRKQEIEEIKKELDAKINDIKETEA